MLGEKDTIAAIGTARGLGALGIVRISGPQTHGVLDKCFSSKNFEASESHRAHFGVWKNPQTGDAVDEVVVLNFAGGRGYTGEPSADVICHGGLQVTELVLESALASGARLARPGEFTYRAVMNNRLDLTRAESVLEIILAKTPRAVTNALNNIRGALSESLEQLESEITFIMAHLEASIDFTTEDIQPVDFSEMAARTSKARAKAEELLKTYVAGRLASRGLRVVLAGKPNGGKSSLLNALVGRKRSIVADLPGTTRDTIEEDFLINGQLFRLVDTAGLRTAEGFIEEEGVKRAQAEIGGADLVLYVVDGSDGMTNEDGVRIREIGADRAVIVFNKSDLRAVDPSETLKRFGLSEYRAVLTSALNDGALDSLREVLVKAVSAASDGETGPMISTQRQKEGLQKIDACLERAAALLGSAASPEFVSFEIKDALASVQELLGKSAGDDVMDRVFKEFCIGK